MNRILAFVFLFAASAVLALSIPGNSFRPSYNLVKVGESIASGTVTTTLITNRDSVYWRTNTAAGGVLPIYSITPPPLSWRNLSSNCCTFDGATLTATDNGTINLILSYGFGAALIGVELRKTVTTFNGPGTNYFFSTNVAGSLAHHISTNLFSRLTGTASTRRPLFTTRDSSTTNFVRNSSFFLADVPGIEAYPAGNNSGAHMMNGCLVSPRHIVSVAHIGSQMGQILYFVNRTNGAVHSRRVVDFERATLGGDFTVAVLDSALPATIVPAAVVTNWQNRLPQYTNDAPETLYLRTVPVVMFNQDVLPAYQRLTYLQGVGFSTVASPSAFGAAWTQDVRGGDSGSPCMVPINGRMAIVGNWTVVNGGGSAWGLASEIQSTMNKLCSRNGYTNETLATISISGFTAY